MLSLRAAAAFAVFVLLCAGGYVALEKRHVEHVLLLLEHDPQGLLPAFVVSFTLGIVALFPSMVLQLISGALYGFPCGFCVAFACTCLGQILAFLLGRYLCRPFVKAYLVG